MSKHRRAPRPVPTCHGNAFISRSRERPWTWDPQRREAACVLHSTLPLPCLQARRPMRAGGPRPPAPPRRARPRPAPLAGTARSGGVRAARRPTPEWSVVADMFLNVPWPAWYDAYLDLHADDEADEAELLASVGAASILRDAGDAFGWARTLHPLRPAPSAPCPLRPAPLCSMRAKSQHDRHTVSAEHQSLSRQPGSHSISAAARVAAESTDMSRLGLTRTGMAGRGACRRAAGTARSRRRCRGGRAARPPVPGARSGATRSRAARSRGTCTPRAARRRPRRRLRRPAAQVRPTPRPAPSGRASSRRAARARARRGAAPGCGAWRAGSRMPRGRRRRPPRRRPPRLPLGAPSCCRSAAACRCCAAPPWSPPDWWWAPLGVTPVRSCARPGVRVATRTTLTARM
jgi:hypothetical protein